MGGSVSWQDRDGVRIVMLDVPPETGLDAGFRRDLAAALDELDRGLGKPRALVLTGKDGRFPSGRPELDTTLDSLDPDPVATAAQTPAKPGTEAVKDLPPADLPPRLGDLCLRIETLDRPVVVALDGTLTGVGFELALAAHGRVARASARIGLTDIALGLPPGAGGSQRLPRMVGAQLALDMMLTGRVLDADEAREVGLIDSVTETAPLDAAIARARALADAGSWPISGAADRGFADPAGYWQALQAARARTARAHPAAEAERRIVQCVEAAQMMPLAQGLAMEQTHYRECAAGPTSRGLRHLARLETRARTKRDTAGPGRPVFTLGVVGASGIGPGMAELLLTAGFGVVLVDETRRALSTGLAEIEGAFDRKVATGDLSAETRAARLRRLKTGLQLSDLAGVDVVIVSPTRSDTARLIDIFGQLGQILRPGCILMSTDPNVDLTDLATASGRGADLLGMLVMPPVTAGDLLELVPGAQTAPDVMATGMTLAARLGRFALRTAAVEGGIARRLLRACRDAADFMVEDGANPFEIDSAMRALGFDIGPYQGLDREGLEVSAARRRAQAPFRDPSVRYVDIGDRLCAMGRFGRRVGKGYYSYPDPDGPGQEDMEVIALIDAVRAEKGLRAKAFTDAEIQIRCLIAMMNAGAQLLVDRVAQRAADIDLAAVHALGFPRWEGGPMWMADQIGAAALKERLEGYSKEAAHFWSPAALVLKLADEGGRFGDLHVVPPLAAPINDAPSPADIPEAEVIDTSVPSAQEEPKDHDHQTEGGDKE